MHCALPSSISHPFYPKCSFQFLTRPPGDVQRYCNACEKDVSVFVYHTIAQPSREIEQRDGDRADKEEGNKGCKAGRLVLYERALQQQQKYEREATLAEIDHSRKILLEKIKEYKGDDLEVIYEASAFASETVEYNDDLLLPPYPSHPPRSLILDKSSSFSPRHKFSRNGLLHIKSIPEARKNTNESEQELTQPPSTSNSPFTLRNVIQVAAKTVLTLVSVASILSLAGFEPRLQRSSRPFKFLHLFQKPAANVKATIQCPPGKIMVMENGEPQCLVKESVQIPFEPVVTMPDINYGCG